MDFSNLSLPIAFIAGLASFLSPCVFSLVPAYIGYLGGRSAGAAQGGDKNRWLTLSHGLAFVLGFSFIFVMLGVASSALGGLLYNMTDILGKVGGVIVIIFGIHMIGIFRLPFLEYDLRRQTLPDPRLGYVSSFLMGIFFSAGWSPCVGPVLGSILTMAAAGGSPIKGVELLSAYSAGLAIPFLLAATQISLVTVVIRKYNKVMRYAEIVMGVILIILGVLLFMGRFSVVSTRFSGAFGIYDELVLGRYILLAIIISVVLGVIPAFIARSKGRDFINWWFFGAGLFIIALPAALLIKPAEVDKPAETEAQEVNL